MTDREYIKSELNECMKTLAMLQSGGSNFAEMWSGIQGLGREHLSDFIKGALELIVTHVGLEDMEYIVTRVFGDGVPIQSNETIFVKLRDMVDMALKESKECMKELKSGALGGQEGNHFNYGMNMLIIKHREKVIAMRAALIEKMKIFVEMYMETALNGNITAKFTGDKEYLNFFDFNTDIRNFERHTNHKPDITLYLAEMGGDIMRIMIQAATHFIELLVCMQKKKDYNHGGHYAQQTNMPQYAQSNVPGAYAQSTSNMPGYPQHYAASYGQNQSHGPSYARAAVEVHNSTGYPSYKQVTVINENEHFKGPQYKQS
jgi:hypothetical protein